MTTAWVPWPMPDFRKPVRLGRHVLDSVLGELRMRGVRDRDIQIHAVSSGAGAGAIVRHIPLPGELVQEDTIVHLFVELLGTMDRLPYALRDEEPEAFGTDKVLALFDSPAAHVSHYVRLGGDLFALRDGDELGARRWLEDVFSIDVELFGRPRWPRLVRFLARLHAVAGRPDCVATALHAMYGFSARVIRLESAATQSARANAMVLGGANSQLGFSSVLSGERVTFRQLVIRIGPISLPQFREHQEDLMHRERVALYALCLPFWINADVTEQWEVERPSGGMRLGLDGTGPRLGWTSYISNETHDYLRENLDV